VTNYRWGIIAAVVALFFSVVLGIISDVAAIHIFIRALIFSVIFFGLGFGLRFIVNSFFPELLFPDSGEASPDANEEHEDHTAVTMDSTGEYAVPELYNIPDDSQELGNIEDLISGVFRPRGSDSSSEQQPGMGFGVPISISGAGEGIDRNNEAGYNDFGGMSQASAEEKQFQPAFMASDAPVFETRKDEKSGASQQEFTPSFGDDSDSGLGGLPDLDMMAMAFSSFTGGAPPSGAPMPPVSQAPSEVEEPEPDRRSYNTGNKPQSLEGNFDPKSLAEGIRTVLSKE